MRTFRHLLCFGLFALLAFGATEAKAQYKNSSFGAYAGALILLPPPNANWWPELGAVLGGGVLPGNRTTPSGHPFSMANGMLSFEMNFKISLESWWLKTGLNIGIVTVQRDDRVTFGTNGFPAGGVVFWLEGVFGPRVYLLTDNVRPYFEIGLRLAGLIYTTNVQAIMPGSFKAMPGFYAAFGLEFIVARDIALTILPRYTLFIPINFPVMHGLEGQFGVISYF